MRCSIRRSEWGSRSVLAGPKLTVRVSALPETGCALVGTKTKRRASQCDTIDILSALKGEALAPCTDERKENRWPDQADRV